MKEAELMEEQKRQQEAERSQRGGDFLQEGRELPGFRGEQVETESEGGMQAIKKVLDLEGEPAQLDESTVDPSTEFGEDVEKSLPFGQPQDQNTPAGHFAEGFGVTIRIGQEEKGEGRPQTEEEAKAYAAAYAAEHDDDLTKLYAKLLHQRKEKIAQGELKDVPSVDEYIATRAKEAGNAIKDTPAIKAVATGMQNKEITADDLVDPKAVGHQKATRFLNQTLLKVFDILVGKAPTYVGDSGTPSDAKILFDKTTGTDKMISIAEATRRMRGKTTNYVIDLNTLEFSGKGARQKKRVDIPEGEQGAPVAPL
jgi:hypothetical protein